MVPLRENTALCCAVALILVVATLVFILPFPEPVVEVDETESVSEDFEDNPGARYYCVRITAQNG